jgi:hypothetical protein
MGLDTLVERSVQSQPRTQWNGSIDVSRPTILFVGRSNHSNPKYRRGTSLRLLKRLAPLAKHVETAHHTSTSIALSGDEFDALRVLAEDAASELTPPSMNGSLREALPILRDSKRMRFVYAGQNQDSFQHPFSLPDQYRMGEDAMRLAGVPRTTAATLSRSALYNVSERLLHTFETMAIDALIVQRAKSPYEFAPKTTSEEVALLLTHGSRTLPALVNDTVLENTFTKYLSGSFKLAEALTRFEHRLETLRSVNGVPFGVLLFDLETIAPRMAARKFYNFIQSVDHRAAQGGVQLRGFDSVTLAYSQRLADGARKVNLSLRADAHELARSEREAERAVTDFSGYYRSLYFRGRDRGYALATDFLAQFAARQKPSASIADCRMLVEERTILDSCIREGGRVTQFPVDSVTARRRLELIDACARLYGSPTSKRSA